MILGLFSCLSAVIGLGCGLCTPLGTAAVSQLAIFPSPMEYDSGRSLSPGDPGIGNGCSLNGGELICPRTSTLLPDGQHGSQNFTPSDGLAWNSDVTIIIGIQPTQITGINMFFYHVPSMGVGLPHKIELSWGSDPLTADNPLEHVILGNQDLSLNDSTLRNVTLVATSSGGTSYRSVGIRFRFSPSENNIQWLIITEIELCNEATPIPIVAPIPVTSEDSELIRLDPNDVQTHLNLSCTVEAEGSLTLGACARGLQ